MFLRPLSTLRGNGWVWAQNRSIGSSPISRKHSSSPELMILWHDRAVFHFLTAAEHRAAYVRQVARAVKLGGHVILSTFGPEGPKNAADLRLCAMTPKHCTTSLARAFA